MFKGKKILVLSPHPDDAELGAGATIAKWLEQNAIVHSVTFSWCKESLGTGEDIQKEFSSAMKKLGVGPKDITNFDFRVRHFPEVRQKILEEMVKLRKDHEPDRVLVPSSFDMHQDHATIHTEAVRAFRHTSLLGFEESWNNLSEHFSYFVALEEGHLQKKIEVVGQYDSQKNKRTYTNKEYLQSLAIVRGQKINKRYAEAFEGIRWIEYR